MPQPSRRCRRLRLTCIAVLLAAFAVAGPRLAAAEPAATGGPGMICIAPFVQEEPVPGEIPRPGEPNMSRTTWAPNSESVFTFRVDKRPAVQVKNREKALISGLPVDRKVLVEVRLDGKPYEAFRLHLGEEPGNRTCLWLYRNYWKWVVMSWGDAVKGCTCEPR